MYQHLIECEMHAENMQISFCFCKTCICLKNLENIQISVSMIDRLDITDEYSMTCDFILNIVIFIDAALNISLRNFWKCNILWFYLFGQGVPNKTKGTITLSGKMSKFLATYVPNGWYGHSVRPRRFGFSISWKGNDGLSYKLANTLISTRWTFKIEK